MKLLSAKWLLLGALLFALQPAFGQKKEEQKIRDLINNYATAYENITNTKDLSEILQYVSTDLRSTNIQSTLQGRTNIWTASYTDFVEYLEMIRSTDELKINYDVQDIPVVSIRDNMATAVYTVEYEISRDGSKWSSGRETVSMVFNKTEGAEDWRIIYFNFIGLENEKLRGTCLLELYRSSNGNYVAKTTVPDGKSYTTNFHNFEFKQVNGKRIIKMEGWIFNWASTGEIMAQGESTTMGEAANDQVGLASSPDDAVVAIVENFIYADKCDSYKVRRAR